ncbi:hypothetical protein KC19_VG010900 [Ceratodon purpureus]|uniref:Uncharacterized protein n=1 Tax=Ceratodon purpureus TaxID=3225 RepID=A0A8T0HKV3_CERPU|nr:hypothetical protein KC19_VG010900 [Ceratodon purpureus]
MIQTSNPSMKANISKLFSEPQLPRQPKENDGQAIRDTIRNILRETVRDKNPHNTDVRDQRSIRERKKIETITDHNRRISYINVINTASPHTLQRQKPKASPPTVQRQNSKIGREEI